MLRTAGKERGYLEELCITIDKTLQEGKGEIRGDSEPRLRSAVQQGSDLLGMALPAHKCIIPGANAKPFSLVSVAQANVSFPTSPSDSS